MIKAGIGELQMSPAGEPLVATSLGSCVAVLFYDPQTKLAGMAHSMLPLQAECVVPGEAGKFVDTAIEGLVSRFIKGGVPPSRIKAYLVGGACMFSSMDRDPILQIGQRNAATARAKLAEKKIHLVAEETGGDFGRTVEFRPADGELLITSVKHAVRKL